jgi:hypothetical protein
MSGSVSKPLTSNEKSFCPDFRSLIKTSCPLVPSEVATIRNLKSSVTPP